MEVPLEIGISPVVDSLIVGIPPAVKVLYKVLAKVQAKIGTKGQTKVWTKVLRVQRNSVPSPVVPPLGVSTNKCSYQG